MKNHQLSEQEIEALFEEEKVGRLATHNHDGFPYITPVHFVYFKGKIYIHGLIKGQKLDNIKNNPKVCFEIDRMEGLLPDERPCDVNTEYRSVVAFGSAVMIENSDIKTEILNRVVQKYMPHLSGRPFSENMVNGTGIIEISISGCTGKYYR
jgi:hypothetical protein